MAADRTALVERLRAAGCVFAEQEADLLMAAGATAPPMTPMTPGTPMAPGTPTTSEQLAALVARRVAGEPLEHVLGWGEFDGLRISVGPGVFVPRPRTEFLVASAAGRAAAGAVVVDLCCGSGAVGVALASRRPDIELHAAELDPTAVGYAMVNVAAVGGTVHGGDLYAALPAALRGRVDLVVANAPYIPTDAIALLPPEARDHEPRAALDGGPDGLDLHRRIAAEAPQWLRPGAVLLLETSAGQAEFTAAIVRDGGMTVTVLADADRDATVVLGRTPL